MTIIAGAWVAPLRHLSLNWNSIGQLDRPSVGRNFLAAPLIAVASVLGAALLFLTAEGTAYYPYIPLLSLATCYLITRFFGCSQGTLSALALLAFLYANGYFGAFVTPEQTAHFSEVAALTFGSVLCASCQRSGASRFSQLQQERSSLSAALAAVERRQREFMRKVIASVTDQRLFVCDSAEELPSRLDIECGDAPLPLSSSVLSHVRSRIRHAANRAGLPESVTEDLVIAGSEAALNAVVHGKNGVAEVYADVATGRVQIWVRDKGAGIGDDLLHRATLERGFSSAGTLGQGFSLIVSTCHRVFLLTGKTGTTVVIEGIRH